MSNTYIAEFHDIYKMIDTGKFPTLNLKGQQLEQLDFPKANLIEPNSPGWLARYCDDIRSLDSQKIDEKYISDVFITHIADVLASVVSRTFVSNKGSVKEGIYKLWNHEYYSQLKKHWAAIKDFKELQELFTFIDTCNEHKEFLNKYKENLLLTPEDKSEPCNIVSLYTHLELVGKIYRVLKKNSTYSNRTLTYGNEMISQDKEAMGSRAHETLQIGKWQARLLKCKIRYPHSFTRLQDINLIAKRNKIINEIIKKFDDEILLHANDYIILFLPLSFDEKNIFSDLINEGFIIDIEETIADLGILTSNVDKKIYVERKTKNEKNNEFGRRKTKLYKKFLNKEFNLKIKSLCEICQSDTAKPRVKDNVTDWLCDSCFEIRKSGKSFKEYGKSWEDEEKDVCWFKITIDEDKVLNWLEREFGNYIDSLSLKDKSIIKQEFRPLAVQIDFVNEYNKMIKDFRVQLEDKEDFVYPIENYDEIGVFKYSYETFENTINKFIELYKKYFPNCSSDINSPISLSLKIADIKYPLREFFRFFDDKVKNFINIQKSKIFIEKFSKDEFMDMLEALKEKPATSFLNKLIDISTDSNILLMIEFYNMKDKYKKLFNLLSEKISPSKILNYYKIYEPF